ncbi:MAG: alpha/beta fold hydrolase [Candidatus Aenigmatarchaeota archaeon]
MGKIFFENSKGDRLCGILSDPMENKRTVVILAHGFSSSKESRKYVELEEIFNEKGLATFRFDFYGHGESEGKFEDITISEASDDILFAISFLKKKKYAKIGLVGNSFGGIASIIAASRTRDLFALCLISPVVNYAEHKTKIMTEKALDDWKNKGYTYYIGKNGARLKLNYTFLQDSYKNDGYAASKSINVSTLIVHGDKDKTVPITQSKKASEIIKECKLEIIKGADHRYTNPKHSGLLIKLVSRFMIEKATSSASS